MSGYRDQQAVELASRFRDRLKAIPGVESVANARMIPLQGSGFGLGSVRVPGVKSPGREDGRFDSDWDVVSPEYFDTIDMQIVEGRAFLDSDRIGRAVGGDRQRDVRETGLAGTIGDRTDVLRSGTTNPKSGRCRSSASSATRSTATSARRPRRSSMCRCAQQPIPTMEFYIRHAPGRQVAQDMRTAMAQVEPNVPIVMLQSFDDATAIGLLPQKLAAWIAGSVGTIGIFLAALGLYGLMAFLVAQRTREIAIRMALGASHATCGRWC